MNSITLLGRLCREPDCRMTNTGKTCTVTTIAVDRPYTNAGGQKEADFINLVAWGKVAETMGNYVKKGQRILVQGRLQIRSYDDNGQKKWITEVIVNTMDFIEKREQQNNNPGNPAANFGTAQPDSSGFGG